MEHPNIEIIVKDNKQIRFTFTPTRTTVKYKESTNLEQRETILKIAKRLRNELGDIKYSWRGTIRSWKQSSITLSLDSKKSHKVFEMSELLK